MHLNLLVELPGILVEAGQRVIVGLLHYLNLARLHQLDKRVQNLRPVFSALFQEYAGKAVCNLEGPIRFHMHLDALSDHLIGRKIAFIGNALEDPSILGIIEIELPQIGNDLPMQRSIPEEVFVQPDGLVDLEAEGNKGHVLLSGYKIFTSFAFDPVRYLLVICPALKKGCIISERKAEQSIIF